MVEDNAEEVIIIFSRFPRAGQSKTRLIPALGAEGAANLQKLMTEFILREASRYTNNIVISYCGGKLREFQGWLGTEYRYSEQIGGDIGERMSNAFINAFKSGAKKVVLFGCDTPDNRVNNISACFAALNIFDSVFGPATDGGYYMIGLNTYIAEFFHGIEWGGEGVLAETLEKADSYKLVKILSDVDFEEDIPAKICVVIPTLNEEGNIVRCISSVQTAFDVECIVVDGGSTDNTLKLAEEEGVKLFKHKSSRAEQMNYGVQQSSAEIILFLHADSELLPGWDICVRSINSKYTRFLGCFGLQVRERIPWIWVIEKLVWVRSKLLKKPYGDQALFIRRDEFLSLGKYQDVPIMEDLLLVKEFRKSGPVVQVGLNVLISARRWVKLGVFKTTVYNQIILLLAWLGRDFSRLSEAYRQGTNPLWYILKNKKDGK